MSVSLFETVRGNDVQQLEHDKEGVGENSTGPNPPIWMREAMEHQPPNVYGQHAILRPNTGEAPKHPTPKPQT